LEKKARIANRDTLPEEGMMRLLRVRTSENSLQAKFAEFLFHAL
jgi:hypothetical protein